MPHPWVAYFHLCGRVRGVAEPQEPGGNGRSPVPQVALVAPQCVEPQEHSGNGRITTLWTLPVAPRRTEPWEGGGNGGTIAPHDLPVALQHTKLQEPGGGGEFATLQDLPTALQCPEPQPAGARAPEEEKKPALAWRRFINTCRCRFASRDGGAEPKAPHSSPSRGPEGSPQQLREGCSQDRDPRRDDWW